MAIAANGTNPIDCGRFRHRPTYGNDSLPSIGRKHCTISIALFSAEPGAVFYRDELQDISNPSDSVTLTYAYTRAAPNDWPRPPRRVNVSIVAEVTWPSKLTPTCYVCSPTSFVKLLLPCLSVAATAPTKSGRSVLARQEVGNEFT